VTLTSGTASFALAFATERGLSSLAPAYIDAIEVDVLGHAPLLLTEDLDGTTVESGAETLALSVRTEGLTGNLVYRNTTTGWQSTVPAETSTVVVPLAYGRNVLVVTGTDANGNTVSTPVTVTRAAPTPANGEGITPAWDYTVATGAVHVAWSTDDWYQLQSTNVCYAGTLLYRDLFGGETEPGNSDAVATTQGAAAHFRYDAQDSTRSIVLTADNAFTVTVPCYTNTTMAAALTQQVWVRIAYWNDASNPGWVQGWSLQTVSEGETSALTLMGRTISEEGLITEAYAFTLTNSAAAFAVTFATESGLSAGAPAYIDAITVDVQAHAALMVDGIADGTRVASDATRLDLAVLADGLTGELVYRNTTTGWSTTVPLGTSSAAVPLAYGMNVLVVTGTDANGNTVSTTLTVTRAAPTPATGESITPAWDYTVATGAVHVAWSTDDWYQLQSTNVCLPGTFQFRDLVGGSAEPGDGDPRATTLGAAHFRYDAQDQIRSVALEANSDFRVRIPCYTNAACASLTNSVWISIRYWGVTNNEGWVQGWEPVVTLEGQGVSSVPQLMGRQRDAEGRITEAYAFTVISNATALVVTLQADPALSTVNPAFIDSITLDMLATVPQTVLHEVQTTFEGSGSVTPSRTEVRNGESAHISITAAHWHRIQTLVTNGVSVAEATGLSTYTLTFTEVMGSISNHVVFTYRDGAQNPSLGTDKHIPTAWLAQFGRDENEPFVTSDRSIADKYLLNLNPYETADVQFTIKDFSTDNNAVRATVQLLVDGEGHAAVNGTLQLEGKVSLDDAEWTPVAGTPITGATFTNGQRTYEFPKAGYQFFRVTVR